MRKKSSSDRSRMLRRDNKTRRRNESKSSSRLDTRVLGGGDININKEIDYILERTLEGISKIVSLDKLILFSTDDGDAWMIDSEDKGAHCLMKGFERKPFTAFDTDDHFYVKWEALYKINVDQFL